MINAGVAIRRKPNIGNNAKRRKIVAIAILIIGLVTLAAGVVFWVINLVHQPAIADGERLINAAEWVLCESAEDSSECTKTKVVWAFSEIGKGTLTTDGHEHDYDFIWALEDGKLLIETKWLYDLENTYEYNFSSQTGCLILADGEGTYRFTPVYPD